jgi:hypothetical protein
MVRTKVTGKEMLSYLELPKKIDGEPIAETFLMAVEYMKHQGEVAYEVGKRQAIAITSTASTIGIGWSAFFFGIVQESWFSSSLGLMMVFAGTYILAYWTPKVLDKVRQGLDDSGASRLYSKWLYDHSNTGTAEKGP